MENKNSCLNLRKKPKNNIKTLIIYIIFFLLIIFFTVFDLAFIPPINYSPAILKTVKIKEGYNLNETSEILKKERLIKSKFIFKTIAILLHSDKKIKAGTYSFYKPYSSFDVVKKLITRDYGVPIQKILIKEGQTLEEIGEIFEKEGLFKKEDFFAYVGCCALKILPNNSIDFLKFVGLKQNDAVYPENNQKIIVNLPIFQNSVSAASISTSTSKNEEYKQPLTLEGFFFPDTYFFPKNIEPKEAVKIVLQNFTNKMNEEIMDEIKKSGKNFYDVLIIASILEKEAKTMEDKKIIADIIQKRMDSNMPLQVDASLDYTFHKNTFELTKNDLLLDSPYNTYKYKGLPPTPISNPGLDSIRSALNPTPNNYWYYLSDKSGSIYYSVDYQEHQNKKAIYLLSAR